MVGEECGAVAVRPKYGHRELLITAPGTTRASPLLLLSSSGLPYFLVLDLLLRVCDVLESSLQCFETSPGPLPTPVGFARLRRAHDLR